MNRRLALFVLHYTGQLLCVIPRHRGVSHLEYLAIHFATSHFATSLAPVPFAACGKAHFECWLTGEAHWWCSICSCVSFGEINLDLALTSKSFSKHGTAATGAVARLRAHSRDSAATSLSALPFPPPPPP